MAHWQRPKIADDAVDTSIGASKARYVAIVVSAALIVFQKGGEAKLHKGDTVEVEPRREKLVEAEFTPKSDLASKRNRTWEAVQ